MSKSLQDTLLKTVLRIPESLFDVFAERAAKKNMNADQEILRHLGATATYNSSSPIYLDDDTRNELSTIAGRTLQAKEDVLAWAKAVAALQVGEVNITLPLTLAGRLSTRRFGKSWKEYLTQTILECLEERVGLR
jgi:hypothetical protein